MVEKSAENHELDCGVLGGLLGVGGGGFILFWAFQVALSFVAGVWTFSSVSVDECECTTVTLSVSSSVE